jgi:hypothetical protein
MAFETVIRIFILPPLIEHALLSLTAWKSLRQLDGGETLHHTGPNPAYCNMYLETRFEAFMPAAVAWSRGRSKNESMMKDSS